MKIVPPDVVNKKHILCLFDYACTTGFATVTQNIIPRLRNRFPHVFFDIVAINYFGEPYMEDERTRVLPAAKLEEGTRYQDAFGRYAFLRLLKNNDYDAVFIVLDIPVINAMLININALKQERKEQKRKQFELMVYFPIDIAPYKPDYSNIGIIDHLVSYTEFGKKELLKLFPDLDKKISVIYHGINDQHFFVNGAKETEKFRSDYFGDHADRFIVTCVNRNQPRKDIPTTIFGFREFYQKVNPHSVLYLHMTPDDPMGWDLKKLVTQAGLRENENVLFPPPEMNNAAAGISTLRNIYNASDVFLTTNMGEGWGLTITEAMACGLPVIAPLHSSMPEISGQGTRIFALDEFMDYSNHMDSDVRPMSDYRQVSELLEQVYKFPQLAKERAALAKAWVDKTSWNQICEDWYRLWKSTILR